MRDKDPHNKNQHEPGAKMDFGKPRVDLVLGGFPRALWAVSEVGTFGANKYTDDGWKEVPHGEGRYADASLRHWIKEKTGEVKDDESHLLHKAHKVWNDLAVLEKLLLRLEVERGLSFSDLMHILSEEQPDITEKPKGT